jgi:hypothetical protein
MRTLSSLVLGLGLFAAHSQAAVVYIPGPIYAWDFGGENRFNYSEYIDMDNDGTRDFYMGSASDGAYLVALGENRVLSVPAIAPEIGRYTVAMTGGELIGASPAFGVWLGRSDYFDDFDRGAFIYGCSGRGGVGQPLVCISTIPSGVTDAYFGVEFLSGGELHYGWITVKSLLLAPDHRPLVNGWAYELQPGQAIVAAQIPEPTIPLLIAVASTVAATRRRRSIGPAVRK